MKREYDLVVIGAGAAGMLCAGTAAEEGLSVLLLEKNHKVGRKLPYTFARMEDIDVLICEQEPEPDVMAAARQGGVTVL